MGTILKPLLAALAAGCLGSSVIGAEGIPDDAPPVKADALLAELGDLETKRKEILRADLKTVLDDMEKAGKTPRAAADLYAQAVEATKYAGAQGANQEFLNWKRKEDARLQSKDFGTAAQLHLRYLGLSVERAMGVSLDELVPDVETYVKDLLAWRADVRERKPPTAEFQECLNDDYFKHPYVDYFAVGRHLGAVSDKEWERSPGGVDGIMDKMLLPFYRAQKSPKLLEFWDMRIQDTAGRAKAGQKQNEIDKFDNEQGPELRWRRAKDMAMLGLKNKAIQEMMTIIRQHSRHQQFNAWCEELKKLLAEPSGT
jgi:hypothetical protein